MSDDRPSVPARLWRGSLLILGSSLCLWLAAQLLAQIWIPLAVAVALAILAAAVIRWRRSRDDRW